MTEPLDSAPFELADATALRACIGGTADPDQQKRAMEWIVKVAGRINRPEFDPGSDRISAFMGGRRFVALQVMRLATTPSDQLKAEIAERDAKRTPPTVNRRARK